MSEKEDDGVEKTLETLNEIQVAETSKGSLDSGDQNKVKKKIDSQLGDQKVDLDPDEFPEVIQRIMDHGDEMGKSGARASAILSGFLTNIRHKRRKEIWEKTTKRLSLPKTNIWDSYKLCPNWDTLKNGETGFPHLGMSDTNLLDGLDKPNNYNPAQKTLAQYGVDLKSIFKEVGGDQTDNRKITDAEGNKANNKEKEKEFENVLPNNNFISQFIELGADKSDAYPEYFFSGAINLLSMAVDRNMIIPLSTGDMFPNMWNLIMGYSTISRKSTAIDLTRDVVEEAELKRDKVLPQDFTPEALVDELAENPQSLFMKDEFGEFLSKMERSYQSGIGALFCRLYDCPDYYRRSLRSEDEPIEIKRGYLTMLGACVPAQIARNVSVSDLESGFFPRIAIAWGKRSKERKDVGRKKRKNREKIKFLGSWLAKIHLGLELLHKYGNKENLQVEPVEFYVTDKALEVYNEYDRKGEDRILKLGDEQEISAFFGRVSNMAMKMAALIQIGQPETLKKIKVILEKVGGVDKIDKIDSFDSVDNVDNLFSNSNNNNVSINSIKATNLIKTINFTNRDSDSPESSNNNSSSNLLEISSEAMKFGVYYANELYLRNALKFREYVHRFENDDMIQKVYDKAKKIADKNNRVGHSELLRKLNIKSKEFTECIQTLNKSGRLVTINNDKAGFKDNKVRYQLLFPDGNKQLPDVGRPDKLEISVEIPEELEIVDKEDIEKPHNNSNNSPLKTLILEFLESYDSPIHQDKILNMIDWSTLNNDPDEVEIKDALAELKQENSRVKQDSHDRYFLEAVGETETKEKPDWATAAEEDNFNQFEKFVKGAVND